MINALRIERVARLLRIFRVQKLGAESTLRLLRLGERC
jgi:hypothetical protein